MKVTTVKEAKEWFEKNPGRSVTVEHGDNAVNCNSMEEALLILEPNKLDKPKKDKDKE